MNNSFPLMLESQSSSEAADYFRAKVGFTMGISRLKEKIEVGDSDFQIVDVRSQEFYLKGHIPGAIWVDADQLERTIIQFSKEKMNIVYCYGELCLRGARVCLTAAQAGFPVMELLGNYDGWTESYGFDIEIGQSK